MTSLRRYARRVEELWSSRLERPVILSPREFGLIEEWHVRGVPLAVIASAIEASRTDARGKPAAPPRRLGYLAEAVEEAWRVVVEGRLRPAGEPAEAASAGDPLDAWEASAERGPADWRRWLGTRIGQVRAGESRAQVDREVDEALPAVAPEAVRKQVEREVERRLGAHGRRMEPAVLERTRLSATVDGLRRALGLPRLV